MQDKAPSAVGGIIRLEAPEPPAPLSTGGRLTNVVMGAGPGGLLTACLLAKAGKPVVIVEMRPRPTDFYGSLPVVLNTRGLHALSQLGPSEIGRFQKHGRPVEQVAIQSKGKTVAAVQTYGTCIMRDQAVGLLLETADSLNVPIYWEHKLVKLDVKGKTMTLERTKADGAGVETICLSIDGCLVGADGNFSKVRRECVEEGLLAVETRPWGIKMRYVLAPNPPSPSPDVRGEIHYVLGADAYVCQQPDGVWSLSFSLHDGSPDFEVLNSTEATPENKAKLREYAHKLAPAFASHLLTSDDFYDNYFACKMFDGALVKCSTLSPSPWIALVGDAAHAVAPYTGEGINSALESASILAATLARGGTATDYDRERREDAHAAYQFACRNQLLITGKPQDKCANTFTQVMLGIGKKLGLIEGVIQDYMLGAKAKDEPRVWRYTEIMELDTRHRRFLYPLGLGCFFGCCCCCGRCK